MSARKPRLPFANAWFFPAAALYAAVLLPWSVLALFGLLPTPAGLLSPLGHAHEMLFGFALAVVAGYLLGPQPLPLILSLLGCWALARLGWLFWPGAWWTVLSAALFAGGVAWKVVPRFLGAAKKWRNQTVAPVVASLALLSAIASLPLPVELTPRLMHEALLLLAMLLFFMGGRIIAPAVAGHLMSQGYTLAARVQPKLEGAALILLGLALLGNLLPWTLARLVSGALLLSVGLLAGVRLLRWQPWRCAGRPDLLVLLLGYLWLSLGLLLFGLSLLTSALPLSASLHGLTVGALGTLTFAVMARTRLIYRLRDANARPWIHPVAGLLSLAALARIVPPLLQLNPFPWLLLSAACWSLAFLLLAVLLWQTRGRFTHEP
jgi:uncharacterized protein involved in response to NO